jgi:hypothetical protein
MTQNLTKFCLTSLTSAVESYSTCSNKGNSSQGKPVKQIQTEIKSRILSSPSVLAAFKARWEKMFLLKDFSIVISSDNRTQIIFVFVDFYDLYMESFLVEVDPTQQLIEIAGATN